MKKLLLYLILGVTALTIFSCNPISNEVEGGSITFDAITLGTNSFKEEKTIVIKGYKFIYFDVCSDKDGNFVLQSNEAWICCKGIQFGLAFAPCENICLYNTSKALNLYDIKNYEEITPRVKTEEEWCFVAEIDSVIRPRINSELNLFPYNIGTIRHWC